MDLDYTPEDLAFRARVRAWLEANLPKSLPTLEDRKAWHRKLYAAGFLGMGWPRAYGGQEARPLEQAIVADEMARVNAPPPVNGLGISIVGPTLIVHGTEAQKQRFLKKILTAEEIWCQLYSEPNAGSDLASLRTRAEDKGDHWLVNGQKVWTSGGMISDWGLLLARTDPAVPKHKGISCFLISMRQPGIEVRPLKQITGSEEFSEVFMTNARAEKEHLVGRVSEGWAIAQTTLSYERGGNALSRVTRALGHFNRLVEATKRLKGPRGRAFDDPVVRQKLGRIYAEIEVMRYGALRVLSRLEKGEHPGPESSITKLYYTELDKRFQELAQEILGPYGQISEGGPEEFALDVDSMLGQQGTWAYAFLWSRAGTIYAGSSEIQKNIIGERVLGLPKEARADRK
ncbi:MAG: acyl-CoA dehydrogenase family protein [Candidatus Rokubacteria bacterium]|nr:acyl-CoA dehydrogenase family protein [Candidatus Rokubacteria bacterium]